MEVGVDRVDGADRVPYKLRLGPRGSRRALEDGPGLGRLGAAIRGWPLGPAAPWEPIVPAPSSLGPAV